MSDHDKNLSLEERNRILEKEVALYKEVLDNTIQGIYVIDSKGYIIWIDKLSERMEGVRLEEIVGKKHIEVWREKEEKETHVNLSDLTLFKTMRTGKASEDQFLSFTNDQTGKETPMFFKTFPFYYEGRLEYIYSLSSYVDYSEKQLIQISEYRQKFIDQHVTVSNDTRYTLYDIIGSSPNTLMTISMAQKVAVKDSPVMLYGETGTGKELFAQGIHNSSNYSKGKFVAINCAAIPDNLIESFLFGTVKGAYTGAENRSGLLEDAEGGTLFLDELNSLPAQVQGKLLRVLQEREACRIGSNKTYQVNCRIISATNQEPRKLVNDKILRVDLYYRLAVVTLEIPPLRDRGDDIFTLAMHFIEKYNSTYQTEVEQIHADVWTLFMNYSWPGNVRELEHVIEYMMNFATVSQKELTMKELPNYLKLNNASYLLEPDAILEKGNSLNQMMDNVRKDILEKTLKKNDWNVKKSAKALGISRENLYHFMKKHGIQRP